ncbi:cellulase family glycosylhydrolase [Mycolicibacterium madagascariense]|uniref:cellulase family glycosylhydrolase n=1 Tax=Mycolicibacterium madagascariense TaxID=212765 RepID=UPI0013D40001|nr:cellulase family glycosylhydrolase [Mycolicibacterium madagascariense]
MGAATSCGGASDTKEPTKNTLHIGISYGGVLPSMTDDDVGQALDDAVGVGATWIRMDLSWAEAQPTPSNSYDWDRVERIFAQARQRHLDILPVLVDPPAWASAPGCSGNHCEPADPSQFAAFAGAAVSRFAPEGVHTWEIWNEPNSALFWQPAVDPAAYLELLKASTHAIRAADDKAFILLGGLTIGKSTNGNLSAADFLGQTPESPLKLVDALSVHPYTFPYPASRLGPWMTPWAQADSGLPYLRQVLAQGGMPNMPIWVTEYGAPTGGPKGVWDGSPGSLDQSPDHVSEEQQAIIAADAVATAAAEPVIHAMFWYTDRDLTAPLDSSEAYFGLRRADGSKKAAFQALADAVKRLDG